MPSLMEMLSTQQRVLIEGSDIVLRTVTLSDVSETYLSWMNDAEVNQYMETRHRSQTLRDIESYVRSMIEKPNILFLAIVLRDGGEHIGNIKLEVVSQIHRRGEISLFVGDKRQWGKGIGSQAISLVKDFGLSKLGLHKLTAGCYSNNVASARAFEKAGFICEAVLKEHYLCGNEWVDRCCYACVASQGGFAE